MVRALLGTAGLCCLLFCAGCTASQQESIDQAPAQATTPIDWGESLLAGGTVGVGQFPAKFSFDVTAGPDCLNDFVVFNTGLAGVAGTTANIVAFNKLYSTQGGNCTGANGGTPGPAVYWSYYTGTGSALTSVALSADGTKVAFIENEAGGGVFLRLLKWKAGEGTSAGAPVAVAAGTSWNTAPCSTGSCLISISWGGAAAQDTISEPFYDFTNDVLYVGDTAGVLHKFINVFNGGATAPSEDNSNDGVTGGAVWPITVHAGTGLTSPVYDSVSGNVYVGDSTGRLSFVRTTLSTVGTCTAPCLDAVNLAVGTGGAIVDGPIVDGTNGFVFAINGTETAHDGTILQAPTSLASSVTESVGANSGTTGVAMYGGAFDNVYFNSSKPNIAGFMYVCGKQSETVTAGATDRPAIYRLGFNATTGVMNSVSTSFQVGNPSGGACSPITEFYNNTGTLSTSIDWIFFSVGTEAAAAVIPAGSSCANPGACIMSIKVATGATDIAWPPASGTVNNAAILPTNDPGATSGIVVDNQANSSQASSLYFSLIANSTGAGPGLPSCNTTAGVGCAIKLTQAGLQ
jgi:hypothetical protein